MTRYLKILVKLFQFSQVNFLEYRADFILTWIGDVIMAGTAIIFFAVIYSQTQLLAGWSRAEIFLLLAVVSYLEALIYFLYWDSLGDVIRLLPTGGLDIHLTRPVDFQVWLTFSKISPNTLGPMLPAVVLTGMGLQSVGGPDLLTKTVWYFLLIGAGLVIHYSLLLSLVSLSFLVGRAGGMWEVDRAIRGLGSKPLDVYPKFLRLVFLTIVPAVFFGPFPVLAFRPGFSAWIVLYAGMVATTFLLGSRRLLHHCLRHYTSTGS